jgi:hypothetical protein
MMEKVQKSSNSAGSKGKACNCTSPTEAWSLLFTDSILQKVLLYTNERIARRTATYKLQTSYGVRTVTYNLKTSYGVKTTVHEPRAFISLLNAVGVLKAGHVNMKDL